LNGPFVDQDFPAHQDSIIDPNDEVDDLMDLGPVEWTRIKDIKGLPDGKLEVFHGAIEPNDIKQG